MVLSCSDAHSAPDQAQSDSQPRTAPTGPTPAFYARARNLTVPYENDIFPLGILPPQLPGKQRNKSLLAELSFLTAPQDGLSMAGWPRVQKVGQQAVFCLDLCEQKECLDLPAGHRAQRWEQRRERKWREAKPSPRAAAGWEGAMAGGWSMAGCGLCSPGRAFPSR